MADINPFNKPPLFEQDQVVTTNDLIGLRNGFVLQLRQVPLWHLTNRFKFVAFIACMDLLLAWIRHGKTSTFKGTYNEETGQIDPK